MPPTPGRKPKQAFELGQTAQALRGSLRLKKILAVIGRTGAHASALNSRQYRRKCKTPRQRLSSMKSAAKNTGRRVDRLMMQFVAVSAAVMAHMRAA
jgi:hypothetical protein